MPTYEFVIPVAVRYSGDAYNGDMGAAYRAANAEVAEAIVYHRDEMMNKMSPLVLEPIEAAEAKTLQQAYEQMTGYTARALGQLWAHFGIEAVAEAMEQMCTLVYEEMNAEGYDAGKETFVAEVGVKWFKAAMQLDDEAFAEQLTAAAHECQEAADKINDIRNTLLTIKRG